MYTGKRFSNKSGLHPGLRVMFVCRQQFKLTLPGQLCQSEDLFGTGLIFNIFLIGHNFLKKIDIAWFSVKYSLCFYH